MVCCSAFCAAPNEFVDPVTIKGKVTIFPGKTIIVTFTQNGNALIQPQIVQKLDQKLPAVIFKFTTEGESSELIIKSRYKKPLSYRALIRIKGQQNFVETTTITVMPTLSTSEQWQNAIDELILFDFNLSDDEGS